MDVGIIGQLMMIIIHSVMIHFSVAGAGSEMFQIVETKRYLLTECRDETSFNCVRCQDLGRTCNAKLDTINCVNCRCLGNTTATFYIHKRYGGACVNAEQLQHAAGFGAPFAMFNHPSGVCATYREPPAQYIWPSDTCNTSDPKQLWFWTPGNLLMNYETFTCFDTHGSSSYRPVKLSRCDSTIASQKFICNEKYWFGIGHDSIITHALRHFSNNYLSARTITYINKGNIWTTYPTTNTTICSSAINQEILKVSKRDASNISEIDYLQCVASGKECAEPVDIRTNQFDELSQCQILMDESIAAPKFSVERRSRSFYLKWSTDTFEPLKGKLFNLTMECLSGKKKLKEFYLPLMFKADVHFVTLQECYQFVGNTSMTTSSMATLHLGNNCSRSLCSRQLDAPAGSLLGRTNSSCVIIWNTSVIIQLGNNMTWSVNQSLRLFSLSKTDNNLTYLQWKPSDSSLVSELIFNLTIFCYDGQEQQNASLAETSCLAFATQYDSDEMALSNRVPLEIVLPITFLVIILIVVLVIICVCYYRRKPSRTMKPQGSRANLPENMNNLREMDNFETKAEDNPCYEQCHMNKHPCVTIARNQLYEHTNPDQPRPISDIYEKPMQNVHTSVRALQGGKAGKKTRPVIQPFKKKDNNAIGQQQDDFYDEPMAFIAGSNHLAPPVEKYDNRLSTPYIRTLPREPTEENHYEYATSEDVVNGPLVKPSSVAKKTPIVPSVAKKPPAIPTVAKKPPAIPTIAKKPPIDPNDHTHYNVNHNEVNAPFYDVLDYTRHVKN